MSTTSAAKFALVTAAFRSFGARKPLTWAAFFTLHPLIKALLRRIQQPRLAEISTNAVASAILYFAARDAKIPQDYIASFLWLDYAKLVLEPFRKRLDNSSLLNSFKVLGPSTGGRLIYSALFGQLLSHVLAPTSSPNHKNLSAIIAKLFYNPVWHNQVKLKLLWPSIVRKYIIFNIFFLSLYLITTFRLFRDNLDRSRYGFLMDQPKKSVQRLWLDYVRKGLNTTNTWTNVIFLPNIIAVSWFGVSSRQITKLYVRLVGFFLAFAAFALHQFECSERQLNDKFLEVVNTYLFRTLLISKWRTAKQLWLKKHDWLAVETAVMSLGVFAYLQRYDGGDHSGIAKVVATIKK